MVHRGMGRRRGMRSGLAAYRSGLPARRRTPPAVGLVWLLMMAGILLWGGQLQQERPQVLPTAKQIAAAQLPDTGAKLRSLTAGLRERMAALLERPGEETYLPPPENALLSPVLVALPLRNPVAGRLTSPYGYRTHPTSGALDFHTGVDIAAAGGTAISAALPGVVKEVGESPVYGNYVLLEHGNLSTRYCHCAQVLVQPGQRLREGEYIATVGRTGVATGPHLHLEVLVDDRLADPLWVLPEGEAQYWTLP